MENIQLITLGSCVLALVLIILIIYKVIEMKNDKEIRSLKAIDVIEKPDGTLEIESEKEKEIIEHYVSKAYKGLEKIYFKNTWENKRFLFQILKSIDELRTNIEFNRLEEVDMEKINSIICIFRLGGSFDKRLEKLIFEWENNHIENT